MIKIKIINTKLTENMTEYKKNYMREYRKLDKHKDYQANYMKNYQQKNKEKLSTYKAEWHKKNKKGKNGKDIKLETMCVRLKHMPNVHRHKDKRKGIYDEENFIDRQWIMDTINKQEHKCYYCDDLMLLDCDNQNNKQLTLERINNDLGHIKSNCVMACFECNLLTRYMTHDEFIEYVKYRTKEEGKRTCKTCHNHFDMSLFKHGKTFRMTCLDCYNKDRREKKKLKN